MRRMRRRPAPARVPRGHPAPGGYLATQPNEVIQIQVSALDAFGIRDLLTQTGEVTLTIRAPLQDRFRPIDLAGDIYANVEVHPPPVRRSSTAWPQPTTDRSVRPRGGSS